MVLFSAVIKKFKSQGEKTGWSYIEIPAAVAQQLKPGEKKSFRVKGKIDKLKIEKMSLLPMGEGNFILPLKKAVRMEIGKSAGARVDLQFVEDKRELEIFPELVECLNDEPEAFKRFNALPPSHQRYFSKWITDAKTEATRAKRIAKTVNAMLNHQNFGEMLRSGNE